MIQKLYNRQTREEGRRFGKPRSFNFFLLNLFRDNDNSQFLKYYWMVEPDWYRTDLWELCRTKHFDYSKKDI